jgi:hypothetical protein
MIAIFLVFFGVNRALFRTDARNVCISARGVLGPHPTYSVHLDESDLIEATEMLQEHLAEQPTTGVVVPIKKAAGD